MKTEGTLRLPALLLAVAAVSACAGNIGEYDAEGYFESTEVTVSAESAGRILSFDIEEGQRVEAGVRVGCIDTVQLYLTMRQLQATAGSVLESRPDIDMQVQALKEQLRTLEREKERVSRLLADGAATRQQMDDISARTEVARVQLDAMKSSLQSSVSSLDAQETSIRMQIAQIEDRLAKCRIVSPVSGTVLTKYAEAGETVVSGKPLFKVADMDRVFVRAYFTTAQLASLSVGDKVTVIPDDGTASPKEYEGTVTWISDEAEFTPKNIQTRDERADLVYAVKVSLVNDGNLRLGMYAYVRK